MVIHNRRLWILASSLWLIFLFSGCSGTDDGTPYDREQIITVMKDLDTQADVIWGNSGTEWDAEGERELFPTTDEGWQPLVKAADNMAVIGKNLQTLIDKDDPRAEAWVAYAKGIVDVSQKLALGAQQQDKAITFDDGGVLYQVCTACHGTFPAPIEETAAE